MNKHITEVLVRVEYNGQIWYEVISIENSNASKKRITLVRGGGDFESSYARTRESSYRQRSQSSSEHGL